MKGCHRTLTLVVLFFSLMAPQHAQARRLLYRPGASMANLRAYELEMNTTYSSAIGHFDLNRDQVEMEAGERFNQWDFDLEGRYGFTKNFEGRLGGKFRINQSTQLIPTSLDATEFLSYDNNESGFESFWFGMKYVLDPAGDWRFAIDTRLRQTTYSNKTYPHGEAPPEELILGDNGTEILLGGHASYRGTKYFYVSASGYLDFPANNLSNQIDYKIDGTWVWDYWSFGVGFDGNVSFQNDDYENDPDNKPSMATGETYLYNSINREKFSSFFTLNYGENSWGIGLTGKYDISGRSTDRDYSAGINLIWSSKGVSDQELKVDRFKEYEVEATVIKVSPRGLFVKIDKGLSHDVERGMRFDLFKTDYFGGNLLLASGYIYDVGADSSIVRLTRTYTNRPVELGSAARGY